MQQNDSERIYLYLYALKLQFGNLRGPPTPQLTTLHRHRKKLVKSFSRLDIRKFSFSKRVINEWNNLPEWVINSSSVASVHYFKVKFFADCGRI